MPIEKLPVHCGNLSLCWKYVSVHGVDRTGRARCLQGREKRVFTGTAMLCQASHRVGGQKKTLLAVLGWFRCRGSRILEAWVSPPACLPVESRFVDVGGRVAK